MAMSYTTLVLLQLLSAVSIRIQNNNYESEVGAHKGRSSAFPTDGDWELPETHQVVFEEIGICYDPDADWSDVTAHADIPWEREFNEAVLASRMLGGEMPHSEVLYRPVTALVKKVGSLARMLPNHQAVALTSDRMRNVLPSQNYPDSHCFNFDYSKARLEEGGEDPHGCGFFRKSFQPLQELRQCILKKLDDSPEWKAYAKQSKEFVIKRARGSRKVDNPMAVEEDETSGADADLFNGTNIVKYTFDSIRRADEMIKYVSYKNWDTMAEGLIDEVDKKISETIVTKDKATLLTSDVVQAIRSDCFMVATDSYEGLTPSAKRLKRALPCYQLMWDQVEVSGGNEKPLSNAITMWDESLRYPSETLSAYNTPPICARAAVALIAERTKRAPEKYSSRACIQSGEKSWYKCLHPRHFNCICFALCYKRALEKICEMNEGCCDPEKKPSQNLTEEMASIF